jgi:hypothetical protein
MNSKQYNSVNNIQSDSDVSQEDTFNNSTKTNEEEKSLINIEKNKRPINNNKILKGANEKRFFKTEVKPINSHSNIAKNDKKRRSNSVGSISLNIIFLIQNILPITVKVINFPRNLSLKEIKQRIDVRIDDRIFLKLKYNKRLGVLYIKFRNEIYYNFYSCLFNGRTYYKNGKYLKMIEIQENENLWTPNADEEILMLRFDNSKSKDNFYISYIEKNFRFFSKSKFYNYFYNQ